MIMRSTALVAAVLSTLLLLELIPGSHAAPTMLSDSDNNHLRGRPVSASYSLVEQGTTTQDDNSMPSSSFGRVLQTVLNTSEEQQHIEDLDTHYPLFLANKDRTGRKLTGDAHDMVVEVTYEHIYAILVFLIAATALGIFTSKLGMVSAAFYLIYVMSLDATSIFTYLPFYL
jgi:hypothetical protein